jgi:hypothetical protein
MKSKRDAEEAKQAERVKWLPPGVRGVVVGRNSQIYDEELDVEDLELFAAIEYRALSLLTGLLFFVSHRVADDDAFATDLGRATASVPLHCHPVGYPRDLFCQSALLGCELYRQR